MLQTQVRRYARINIIAKKRRLGILPKTALFCCGSERTFHGETAAEEIGVRPIPVWWRWGELNPRPKALKQELLRAQQVFSGRRTPLFPSGQANRQACQSGSFMMHGTRKA